MNRIHTQRETFARHVISAEPHLYLPTEELSRYQLQKDPLTYQGEGAKAYVNGMVDHVRQNGLEPISLGTDGHYAGIEDGHHRLAAARVLGIKQVPVNMQFSYYANQGDRMSSGLKSWVHQNKDQIPGWEDMPRRRLDKRVGT